MEQYIPKSAVVAEIVRRRKEIPKNETDKALRAVYGNEAFVLTELLSFLDTLEVKEVDLQKEAERFVQTKEFYECTESPVIVIAKHFFELGMAVNNKEQKGE